MSHIRTAILLLALGLFGLGGWALRPDITPSPPGPTLGEQMPARIGEWQQQPNALDQIAATATNLSMEQPYDEVVTRTYQNPRGEVIMLTLAFVLSAANSWVIVDARDSTLVQLTLDYHGTPRFCALN